MLETHYATDSLLHLHDRRCLLPLLNKLPKSTRGTSPENEVDRYPLSSTKLKTAYTLPPLSHAS